PRCPVGSPVARPRCCRAPRGSRRDRAPLNRGAPSQVAPRPDRPSSSFRTPPAHRSRLCEAPLQIPKEIGIADGYRFLLGELHIRASHRAEHREGHGEAVIRRGRDAPPRRLLVAFDEQIIPTRFGARSMAPWFPAMGSRRLLSFTRSSPTSRKTVFPRARLASPARYGT